MQLLKYQVDEGLLPSRTSRLLQQIVRPGRLAGSGAGTLLDASEAELRTGGLAAINTIVDLGLLLIRSTDVVRASPPETAITGRALPLVLC